MNFKDIKKLFKNKSSIIIMMYVILITVSACIVDSKGESTVTQKTTEQMADERLIRSQKGNLVDQANHNSNLASAYYLKLILEEEKKQTEILKNIFESTK